MTGKPRAIIVGVGELRGIGGAAARRFAAEGFHVLLAGRTASRLQTLADAIAREGGSAEAVPTDARSETDIDALFARAAGGVIEVVVFNASGMTRGGLRELTVAQFEAAWRTTTLGGFLVARAAARAMVPQGRGTLLITGATASLRGGAGFATFAAAKAGLRAVAQSAARELGPLGVHVAHVIIDGGVDGEVLARSAPQRVADAGADGLLSVEAIAETYWHLHRQHRSAWTLELDLRPYCEKF